MTVYTGFNLNFDQKRSAESGSRGMGRGTEFRANICGRHWESANSIFTSAESPH